MVKHIPFTVIAFIVCTLLAVVLLYIGLGLVGINLLKILTSPKAYLIYTVLFLISFIVVCVYLYKKFLR